MSGIMSMLLGARAAIAAAVDEFFNRVTLLLPGDGTNGAQNNTFLDSSTNAFSITRNGNSTQGTFSPFSQTGWGVYFNRAVYTDIFAASSADFNFGSGDFTIECFFNPSYVPASGDTTFSRLFDTGQLSCFFYSGNIYLRNAAAAELVTVVAHGLSVGVWYHLAFVRSGTTYYIFRNGSQLTSGTGGTITSASAPFVIGTNTSYNQPLDGNVSNFRVTTGQALYTSTFTPATTPLTTTSQSATASNVKLLTCQSNRFVDNSTQSTKTILFGNNGANLGTRFVQAFSPFAPTAAYSAATVGGSGFFSASTDFLSAGTSTNLALGDGNFTIEVWLYLTSYNGTFGTILDWRQSGGTPTNRPLFGITSTGTPQFFQSADLGALISGSSAVPLNAWSHLAVVRNGTGSNNVTMYLNGASIGSNTGTNTLLIDTLRINDPQGSFVQSGYFSSLRIVKGSAEYTGNFSPPTAPLTAVTNTQLLLNFTNAGITDATAKNDLQTVGNAQISTTQSKFGGSSIYFDGTGDWLYAPGNANLWLGSGDYTVEYWLYCNTPPTTGSTLYELISYGNTGNVFRNFIFFASGSSTPAAQFGLNAGATAIFAVNSIIAPLQWYHVAIVRSGSGTGNTKFYINGVVNATTATNTTDFNIGNLGIGAQPTGTNPSFVYIDDLRITKFARYTANFTPPTSAFALQ
jgi:hypothetical protein